MPKATKTRPASEQPPKRCDRSLMVEVPRADVSSACQLPWDELMALAEREGWRTKASANPTWCRPDHALLREGFDDFRGIPCLHYQGW